MHISYCGNRLPALLLTALFIIAQSGCSRRHPPPPQQAQRSTRQIAGGVDYRFYPAGDQLSPAAAVHVIDIDLTAPTVRLTIAADNAEPHRGAIYADAHSLPDWCSRKEALAGVNGGFFGQTDGKRKEVVGLLALDGKVLSNGSLYQSPKSPDRKFVRSVLSFDEAGMPTIAWMTGKGGEPAILQSHDRPLNPTSSKPLKAEQAVACGPRLIKDGTVQISDADEKLGSPPAVPRTFVGFDREAGRPLHLVLCVTPAMTYANAAAFLQAYFKATHSTACADAMCLDGGSSSQMTYRTADALVAVYASPVTVPTAILVLHK